MPIDFYYFPLSPPCRMILLLGKAIGVHFNLKSINPLKGEQMKAEFLKINPQHTIPTIDDNNIVLWESRVIMQYLVEKYAKDDSLYPKDPKKRGKVDQMLYFDIGTLYDNIAKCYFPIFLGKRNTLDEKAVEKLEKSCDVLNAFLNDNDYVAGDNLTIADFSISTSIVMLETFEFDISRYDNVVAWYDRCKTVMEKFGFEEIHAPGKQIFNEAYRANLTQVV
ncbi:PREDICTED: glutathione S-transferase 1-1-like isoform X1 [Polistes dominula]|uniref:Glutathione S-transferase 1-1-like isoform X1 n=1 Tax=Polistes dominula TaxID=743375 RepID=A0ABM1IL56_POLDO|nr:PREDICTED: glutathione S-transferase 1-1-like isoform X1 [Polistes dominula]